MQARKGIINMTTEDKMILEQYIQYEGISEEKADKCLDILRHSQDIMDSSKTVSDKGPSSFDIVVMSFKATDNDDVVTFNGAISNGNENKWLDGRIEAIANKALVVANVRRLHPSLSEKDKDYKFFELYSFKDKEVHCEASYSTGECFERIMEPFIPEELESYKQSKVDFYKRPNIELKKSI